MSFTFKYLFYILFGIGFYKIAEELLNAIKTKKIINCSTNHLKSLRYKIYTNNQNHDEELTFLSQNSKLLNSTSIGKLSTQIAPTQKLLDVIILNNRLRTDYYLKQFVIDAIDSLILKSIQVQSEIKIYKYILNFINPMYYIKKSVNCILVNFYSIFSVNIPDFIKKTLNLISIFLTVLLTLKTLSPEFVTKFFNWLETLF